MGNSQLFDIVDDIMHAVLRDRMNHHVRQADKEHEEQGLEVTAPFLHNERYDALELALKFNSVAEYKEAIIASRGRTERREVLMQTAMAYAVLRMSWNDMPLFWSSNRSISGFTPPTGDFCYLLRDAFNRMSEQNMLTQWQDALPESIDRERHSPSNIHDFLKTVILG